MQLLEPRDSLVPFVAPEGGAAGGPGAARIAWRVARAGAIGGVVASVIGGVPYYFAVRETVALPWLTIAPRFVAFVAATGAIYGAGAAIGVHAVGEIVRPATGAARALVALAGATLGAALAGALPGAFGAAYFGSLPYPFIGTATLAIAPFVGAALVSRELANATGERRAARSFVATVAATVLFCAIGALGVGAVDDETILAAFRDGVSATSGRPDSLAGLAWVGAVAGALLGLGLGGQMGVSVALAGGAEPDRTR